MDSLFTTVGAAAGMEALKIWGSFALVLILLGVAYVQVNRRLSTKETENAALRSEIAALQRDRLEDARSLIRVTETATSTIASRAQGDQKLMEMLTALVDEVTALKKALSPRQVRSR